MLQSQNTLATDSNDLFERSMMRTTLSMNYAADSGLLPGAHHFSAHRAELESILANKKTM